MFKEGSSIGVYTLIRKLGRGGFGEVWLAERRSEFVTTQVAIKLPHEEMVDREAVRREASLWAQASGHPNVLPIIDADDFDGQIAIVSEYAPGGSLEQWLATNGRMSLERALDTAIGILDGLEFLHSKGIVHRDVKPANILLQGETPRLTDFGISRVMSGNSVGQSQNISGTFSYMSPESFDGKRSVQSDVWAAGVILYTLLSGRHPFPQKETSELIAAIVTKDYEPLPEDVPVHLTQVVAKALSKDTRYRFASAREMSAALRKTIGEGAPVSVSWGRQETQTVVMAAPLSGSARPVPEERGPSSSNSLLAFIAGGSLFSLILVIAYVFLNSGQGDATSRKRVGSSGDAASVVSTANAVAATPRPSATLVPAAPAANIAANSAETPRPAPPPESGGTRRIKFRKGEVTSNSIGSILSWGSQDFVLYCLPGQTLSAQVLSPNGCVTFYRGGTSTSFITSRGDQVLSLVNGCRYDVSYDLRVSVF